METHSDSAPMNGGNGAHSYSKNSFYQKQFADLVKDKIVEVISAKLDVKSPCSVSSVPFTLADLGCSVGPNTVIAMQNFMEAIKLKYQDQGPAHSQILPQFQVFFNDQVLNDFNTLFRSLPQDRQYFAAGVAGSFCGRLFPESSIHFVYSSTALHWLSRVPEELRDRNSAAWNKGRIHYTSAPDEVIKAYSAHFAKDMQIFFDDRAKEIVSGGMMVLIIPASDDKLPRSQDAFGITFNCMASSLMDMVKLGIIAEDEVDSFNIPMYCPCPNEMEEVIEKNGNFKIEKMESLLAASALKGRPINIPEWVAHVDARFRFSSIYDQDLCSINFTTTRRSPSNASSPDVHAHTDKSEYAGCSPGANPPTLKSDMKTVWDSDCCVMGEGGILRVTPRFWGKRGCRDSVRSCVFSGWRACLVNCRRPGLLASRPLAGMILCLLQEIDLADDVLVDEQDISAPVPPRIRLLRNTPARGTLPPDICSPCLVSSTYFS
ncbi:putative S-adenosyl-L-methionine:salicylic acid carboxyl methyltransferase [Citrus sinensis]|nr:putative S-adenosyl-L-methionine:salicylic acid carboxyl methyltransferase [Citrus sinensis]